MVGLTGAYGFVPGVSAQQSVGGPTAGSPKLLRGSPDRSLAGVVRTVTTSLPGKAGEKASVGPAYVEIDALGTTSSLIPLRLREDGTLQVPTVASQAGWFSQGVVPGEPGPAVIVGHLDSYFGPAVFARLGELRPGDEIRVARTDGSIVTFKTTRVDQYPKDFFPTGLVYSDTSESELRLITCAGNFDRSQRSYQDNIVVYATKV